MLRILAVKSGERSFCLLWRKHVGEGPVLKKDPSEEANAVAWARREEGEMKRSGQSRETFCK